MKPRAQKRWSIFTANCLRAGVPAVAGRPAFADHKGYAESELPRCACGAGMVALMDEEQ